ncbi:secreted protein [marine sediment metagenome]|uniref:Secreted protein n=1 Tax=marine sediment metagenome TaxID=412755 RepID=A0A1B6NSN9_9ZZZZ
MPSCRAAASSLRSANVSWAAPWPRTSSTRRPTKSSLRRARCSTSR